MVRKEIACVGKSSRDSIICEVRGIDIPASLRRDLLVLRRSQCLGGCILWHANVHLGVNKDIFSYVLRVALLLLLAFLLFLGLWRRHRLFPARGLIRLCSFVAAICVLTHVAVG
jgi:hypothetical protein